MPISLRYAARSNVGLGSKDRNEDSGYASASMLILADGMGGHAAGDVASSTVVGALSPLDGEEIGADDALDQLADHIEIANEKLRKEMDADPSREGMGTTLIVLMKAGRQLAMANIGDSRAFHLREDKFTQITKDHSFVQSLLDEGRISAEEAVHHPQRSLVTRVLTGRDNDVPDLSLREARIGDRYLLCSDGLSDYVSARTIEEIFKAKEPIEDVADHLIEIALKGSTRDNVTVVIAEVIDSDDADPSAPAQVVGAAMTHGTTGADTPHEQTPAEKAAALSRSMHENDAGAEPANDTPGSTPILAEQRPRLRGRLIAGLSALVLIIALAVAAILGWMWTQSQYFVKDDGGRVAIYQGVDSELGPIHLSHLKAKTDIVTNDLPSFWKSEVTTGITASSQKKATQTTENLRSQMATCMNASDDGSECAK